MSSIRNFRQVEGLCKQVLGKCHVMNMGHESHALGFLEVRIIAGRKPNPSFNPDARIGEKAQRFEADKYILFIKPGDSEENLIKRLKRIKEKAQHNAEEVRMFETVSPREQKKKMDRQAEIDIAMKLEAGEEIQSDDSDDFSDMIEEFDAPLSKEEERQKAEELSSEEEQSEDSDLEEGPQPPEEEKTQTDNFQSKVLSALQVMGSNMDTINGNISVLHTGFIKMRKDVDNLKKVGTSSKDLSSKK